MKKYFFLSFIDYGIRLVLMMICFPVFCNAQTFTKQQPVRIGQEEKKEILQLVAKNHKKDGICSNINVQDVYLERFIESADYGPMWYGDTINVYKSGYLISYDYDYVDKKSPRIIPYRSDDWHSAEKIFIAKDRSCAFRLYTCRFGGVPPSHGYANRKIEWHSFLDKLLEVINKYSKIK